MPSYTQFTDWHIAQTIHSWHDYSRHFWGIGSNQRIRRKNNYLYVASNPIHIQDEFRVDAQILHLKPDIIKVYYHFLLNGTFIGEELENRNADRKYLSAFWGFHLRHACLCFLTGMILYVLPEPGTYQHCSQAPIVWTVKAVLVNFEEVVIYLGLYWFKKNYCIKRMETRTSKVVCLNVE